MPTLAGHPSAVHEPASTAALPTGANHPTGSGADVGFAVGPLPHLIGRYLIEAELARGGMGIVYRGLDPALARAVAVKVIRPDRPGAESARRRFLEEAHITGQLQHPAIPPVHELGETEDGQPFLAMKLIHGQTFADLLGQGSGDLQAQRGRWLSIFEQVCQAVAYAHSKGIVHRDLKPANVMVGAFGEVQVMDWGLAKVLSESELVSTDAGPGLPSTLYQPQPRHDVEHTQAGTILGTPAFMPPEQAAGLVEQIDRQADVFALGAMLCMILTGEPPYTGGSAEALRGQAALGDLADAHVRLDRCGAEPALVALARQCLAPKKADRPADAGLVAAAVANIRAEAEARARTAERERGEALVRAEEQGKRRQVWLGLAATLLVGLIVATSLALWANHARQQALNAQTAEKNARGAEAEALRQAQAKEQLAEEQAELATAVKDFLLLDFLRLPAARYQFEKSVALDPDLKVRDMLLRASERITGKFKRQPKVEAELQRILAWSLFQTGRADLALPHYVRYRELMVQLHGPGDAKSLKAQAGEASALVLMGRTAAAAKLYESAYRGLRDQLGPDHEEVLDCLMGQANCLVEMNRMTEAIPILQEVLRGRTVAMGPKHEATLRTQRVLATTFLDMGKGPTGTQMLAEVYRLQKEHLGPRHPDTLLTLLAIANGEDMNRREAQAEKHFEEALTGLKETQGPEHPDTLRAMHMLMSHHVGVRRHAEGAALGEVALPIQTRKYGSHHPDTLRTMNTLAICYKELGRLPEALDLYERAIAAHEEMLKHDSGNAQRREALAGLYCNVGNVKHRQARYEEVVSACTKAIALLEPLRAEQPNAVTPKLFLRNSHRTRARAYEALRQFDPADADWEQAVALSFAAQVEGVKKEREQWRTKREGR